MQNKSNLILLGLLLLCFTTKAQKVEFNEKIKKEFSVAPNSCLAVYNINGNVKIVGYNGNKVSIEIDKTLSASTKSILENAKKEFKLEFDQTSEKLMVYITEPVDSRPKTSYNNWDNHDRIKYDYKLDFIIKLPKSMSVIASTIVEGDVTIEGVDNTIKANNINGGIYLDGVKNQTDVNTINGDVNVNYAGPPGEDSKYYSLNGKMTIHFPKDLKATCDFKSFNGDLFTDFQQVDYLPALVTKTKTSTKENIKYKLNKKTKFEIGGGGTKLHFETFNGSIYIKKQS